MFVVPGPIFERVQARGRRWRWCVTPSPFYTRLTPTYACHRRRQVCIDHSVHSRSVVSRFIFLAVSNIDTLAEHFVDEYDPTIEGNFLALRFGPFFLNHKNRLVPETVCY